MSLNSIALPASLVAELYGQTLTLANPAAPGEIPAQNHAVEKSGEMHVLVHKEELRALGNNAKKVLIVVNNPDNPFLPDNELQFLTGILSACQLSLDDVALVNWNNNPGTTGKELTALFNSRVVLLFDTAPAALELPVHFPFYQIQPFAGTTYLSAPSLGKLENDKLEKSKLWVCLKRLFNL